MLSMERVRKVSFCNQIAGPLQLDAGTPPPQAAIVRVMICGFNS